MATIKDVAEHAKVSVTTVSYVLNKNRRVSPDLEKRVWEAVKAIKYQPNALARSLRSKQTRTLGMLVPDNSNPFLAEITRYIENECFALGYNIILCNTEERLEKEQRYIDVLLEKQIDGIILVSAGGEGENLKPIFTQGLPLVVVDCELHNIECDMVVTDQWKIGQQATRHLIERGHKRIACITAPRHTTPSTERTKGYRETLEAAGIPYEPALVRSSDFQAASGYSVMQQLLDLDARPTGVFVYNDSMAIGALCAIHEAGLRIPEDIAVVGVDDIAMAAYITPRLTTVAQPLQGMSKLAAKLLVGRISGGEKKTQRYVLETTLVVRKTT